VDIIHAIPSMPSADCSTDVRGASAAVRDPAPLPRSRWPDLLHGLAPVVGRAGAVRITAYVLLSLATALLGSIAAVALVPLIQPGHAPVLGGRELKLPASAATLMLVFAMSIGAHTLLRWFVSGLGARVVGDCAVKLRARVHARLIDADIAALDDATSAEIANVLTSNIELVTRGISAMLQLLVAGVTTAVNIAFAFWVSPVLTLVLPALAGLGLMASRCHGREQSRVSRQYVEDTTRLFRSSEDFPRRLRHVRSFEREDAEQADYGTISARLARGYQRQVELVASGKLMMELLAAIGMIGIFLLAGHWQGVDQASLIAVGLLLGRLLPYMGSSRHNFQQLRQAMPAFELWQRYANLDRIRRAMQPAADTGAIVARIHIERVRLAWPSLRVDIKDLLLIPGEMTLVAGDSGIGKSSLADVVAGMATPVSFAARIDGDPVDYDTYRQFVRRGAYVSQGVRPWQRTVRECLLWAAPGATDRHLREALTDVGFAKRLRDAHGDLDTELQGASCRLSGGELQRLLLAQVILRQPFIAVLDEATGALDEASETNVLATLKRRLPQTILIVVSHRRGPLVIADQCLRLGHGGVATIVRKGVTQAPGRLG
jgi:ATP-binding cassette subfamily C protein